MKNMGKSASVDTFTDSAEEEEEEEEEKEEEYKE